MINWDISGNESLAWVDPTSVAAYAKGEIDAGASHSTMGPESREKSLGFFKGKSSETMGNSTLKYRGIRSSKPIQVSKFYPILAK